MGIVGSRLASPRGGHAIESGGHLFRRAKDQTRSRGHGPQTLDTVEAAIGRRASQLTILRKACDDETAGFERGALSRIVDQVAIITLSGLHRHRSGDGLKRP